MNRFIDISEEVKTAKAEGEGIVALESTIVAHGMPWPKNFETAQEVEQVIRDQGAVPATIALIDGKMKVGLSQEELKRIAQSDSVLKISRRDLPFAIANKSLGATTVAATMIIAQQAGIKVFVTGGIGGVHRGYNEVLDVSADLKELEKTNVAVICAGVKSILDIGNTLEYLETSGVPVVAYRSDEFPAFYTRESGFRVEHRMENAEEIARMLEAKWELGLNGGVVIGNPVPEEYSMDKEAINATISSALEEATREGVSGKHITPFLLNKIKELTGGRSLEANIALVLNNARLGAELACQMT